MSTNLRLSSVAAAALRRESARTGRSQQQLLREAVDTYLGLGPTTSERDHARSRGIVRAGTPFVDVEPSIHLPAGQHTSALMARDDER